MMDWTKESYSSGSSFNKDSVDILDVLVKVGGRIHSTRSNGWWDDEVAVFCMFCSDSQSKKPAGRANTTKQVYHCWACGFGGDVISIAKRYLCTDDFATAVRWLNEVVGSAK